MPVFLNWFVMEFVARTTHSSGTHFASWTLCPRSIHPSRHFIFGRKTGAAVPLLWAHAEYVKLRRSAADGKSSDLIEAAYDRYVRGHREDRPIEVWKFNRRVPAIAIGTRLRIQASSPF